LFGVDEERKRLTPAAQTSLVEGSGLDGTRRNETERLVESHRYSIFLEFGEHAEQRATQRSKITTFAPCLERTAEGGADRIGL
jgi:hypothetical protein